MGDRRGGGMGGPERGGYKVLCVSALHPKASDDVVRDTLYREYKKYGDISVRVMHEPAAPSGRLPALAFWMVARGTYTLAWSSIQSK